MTDARGAAEAGESLDEFFQPNYDGRRRRGFTIFMVVVIVLVVVLAVAAVIAEIAVRTYAEGRAEKEIESSLPAGTTGKVGVTIHGFSAILQALGGSFDNVTLQSHDLVVSKVPIRFTADLTDVPLKAGGTTGPVTATLSVDESGLNQTSLVHDIGGNITLTSGHVTYDKSITILGLALKARVTAKPSIESAGTELRITPTSASITTSNSSIDGSSLLTYLKTIPLTVCTSKYLPKGAKVDSITVVPNTVSLDLSSKGLPLTSSALSSKGNCS